MNSTQRKRLSSARMLCAFSVRWALLRPCSGCCSSRLLTISVSKARCRSVPGLRYSWNRDESLLHLTYDVPDGDRQTFTAELQEDVFRDQRGQVVGRVLLQGDVAIELRSLPLIPANDNEPKLCPDYSPTDAPMTKAWDTRIT